MDLFKKIFFWFLVPVIIFFTFFFVYAAKTTDLISSVYYYDEYSWVGRGYFFELFIKGDFKNNLWRTRFVDGDNKLTSYIYGLANYPVYKSINKKNYDMLKFLIDNSIFTSEFQHRSNINTYWNYFLSKKDFVFWEKAPANGVQLKTLLQRYGKGFEKTLRLIFRARKTAVIFFSLSIVIVYFIGILFFRNILFGLIFAFIYGSSYLLSEYGIVAYTEPIFVFFISLSLLEMVFIFKKDLSFFKRMIISVLLGVTIALANQTKLNGILLLAVFYALSIKEIILSRLNKGNKYIWQVIIQTLVVSVLFLLFYIAIDPFLYKNTFKNIIFQYQWTYKQSVIQYNNKIHLEERLPSFINRLVFVFTSFFIRRYAFCTPFFLTGSIIGFLWSLFFNFIVFLSALKSIIDIKQIKKFDYYQKQLVFIFTAYFFIYFISILFTLNLAWGRYLTPLILPIILIFTIGLKKILDFLNYDYK